MSGGGTPVKATFWLLDAPDALVVQSERNPDGYGLGTFYPDGTPELGKRPVAAHADALFAAEAREEASPTYLAHVRFASTGGLSVENTHPFEQHGRLFAHNGVVEGLDRLDAELGDARSLVRGDTDSERLFALVTREIDRHGGDVRAGVTAAVRWVAAELPLYSINFVLTTATDLWALRYPEGNELYVLDRAADGERLDAVGTRGTVRVRADDCAERPVVVVASERMDDDPRWRAIESGELLHVGRSLSVSSERIVAGRAAHQLTLEELGAGAASQAQAGRASPPQ
jgi:predicted glutamine amidotransferase